MARPLLKIALHLAIGAWGISLAGASQAQAGNAPPPATARKLTAAEEELLVAVESTWTDFVDKAARQDRRALEHLAPGLREAYARPSMFAALTQIKSRQKDFGVTDIDKTWARLASVLTSKGADHLQVVMLEKRGGRWYIAAM